MIEFTNFLHMLPISLMETKYKLLFYNKRNIQKFQLNKSNFTNCIYKNNYIQLLRFNNNNLCIDRNS